VYEDDRGNIVGEVMKEVDGLSWKWSGLGSEIRDSLEKNMAMSRSMSKAARIRSLDFILRE
jgi:hypothetical protein